MPPQLSKLSIRINRIPGNSVLAEHDWSIMNLIKTKTRNQLSNINVDNRPRDLKKKLRYTQSIEIDEKKLLNMKDRLLQEEVAMARLNPSNDEVLKEFLNSIVDDEMTMKHSNN